MIELNNIEFDDTRLQTLIDLPRTIYEKSSFIPHGEVLEQLLDKFQPIDFREKAGLEEDEKIRSNHLHVIVIEQVLESAKFHNWGLCRKHTFIYLYNGAFWSQLKKEVLEDFLGQAAEKMGVEECKARHFQFREHLFKQFLSAGNLPEPTIPKGTVLVNLKNGTFEVTPEKQFIREPRGSDFLTYQLPFDYNPMAKAPKFEAFLNRVLPDKDRQKVLSEFLGYLFIHPSTLKLEKTLLLYGSGANGKSVCFSIVSALIGEENISGFPLQDLTDTAGYSRVKLTNKLVNYASEINGKLESSIFKQLVSGEPVAARLPYGEPFSITNYAKLIFNCNELPKDVEHTNAYFRRFLIIPFDVTIPEAERDTELANSIISSELSGVFNWVLEGLNRLIAQKKFTDCEAVRQQIEDYKRQSDSVQLFLEDENYIPSLQHSITQKQLYGEYRAYCFDSGYKSCSSRTFGERLKNAGFIVERKNYGRIVFTERTL